MSGNERFNQEAATWDLAERRVLGHGYRKKG